MNNPLGLIGNKITQSSPIVTNSTLTELSKHSLEDGNGVEKVSVKSPAQFCKTTTVLTSTPGGPAGLSIDIDKTMIPIQDNTTSVSSLSNLQPISSEESNKESTSREIILEKSPNSEMTKSTI